MNASVVLNVQRNQFLRVYSCHGIYSWYGHCGFPVRVSNKPLMKTREADEAKWRTATTKGRGKASINQRVEDLWEFCGSKHQCKLNWGTNLS